MMEKIALRRASAVTFGDYPRPLDSAQRIRATA
jgi:hypothetical protein